MLFNELKKLHPWKYLQDVNIPILFIHGDADTYVPYEDSVKYSKLMKKSNLVTIHGADHGFHENKEVSEQADKATLDFFLENL